MKVEKNELGELQANCYLLTVGDEAAIIDPGAYEPELEFMIAFCDKPIRYILLTHRHCDHVMAAAAAKDLTGAKVVISAEDAEGLSDPEASLAAVMTREKQFCIKADRLVGDGDLLPLGGEEIRVIATPGHTVGGVCYLIGDKLFTGDTLFQKNIGRSDLPTGDYATLKASLKKLANLEGDYTIYPGHGENTTLEMERKNNPYMKLL